MSALSISNLSKIYQDPYNVGIDHISFELPYGQAVAILGKNGAGKSTLLNIIGSIIKKTEGCIKVCGLDLDKGAKHYLGFMPQEPFLNVFLNLEQYLKVWAWSYGIEITPEQIWELLDKVGLLPNLKHNTKSLSGGMKRRFCLAKAMLHNPQVLILDEPTAAVDVNLSRLIMNHLKAIKSTGRNIILSTHQFHEVEELCDRIIVIDNGKIKLDGPVKDILPIIRHGFNF